MCPSIGTSSDDCFRNYPSRRALTKQESHSWTAVFQPWRCGSYEVNQRLIFDSDTFGLHPGIPSQVWRTRLFDLPRYKVPRAKAEDSNYRLTTYGLQRIPTSIVHLTQIAGQFTWCACIFRWKSRRLYCCLEVICSKGEVWHLTLSHEIRYRSLSDSTYPDPWIDRLSLLPSLDRGWEITGNFPAWAIFRGII